MRCLILLLLFAFSAINLIAKELPVVRFPSKQEVEKLKIKNLIKELDASNKEETTKREKSESLLEENKKIPHLDNRPLPSKNHFKKNRSRLLF